MLDIGKRVIDTSGIIGVISDKCGCGCNMVMILDDVGVIRYTYITNLTPIDDRPKKIEPLPLPG